MFYFGNLLIFLFSSIAVELTAFVPNNQYSESQIVMLAFCAIVIWTGFRLALANYNKLHKKTAIGKSLGIAMIVTALLSLVSEDTFNSLTPSLILEFGYLVPGILIYKYNAGANALSLRKLRDNTVKFLKSRLEARKALYAPQLVYNTEPKSETISVDEVILNLNLAHRIYTLAELSALKDDLKKCQLYLLEMKKHGDQVLGSYNYLLKEINNLAIIYMEIASQYIQTEESMELYKKLENAFDMINIALGNIFSNYLKAKTFHVDVSIKALELQLGEEGLLQSKFKIQE